MTIKQVPPDDYEDPMPGNPLAKYFRVPGVHVRLPSNGSFMPPGSVAFSMTGDVPVYPMRAADEILLKSPDALMSGYAIEKLVESCVPAIKFPRLLSSADIDVLLLAIRAATYGEIIELTPTCPNCSTENPVHRSLTPLLASMKMIDPENPVRLSDDVVAYVRPSNLINATTLGIASFEETRKVQAVEEADDATKRTQINASMQRISTLATEMVADSVQRIVVPEGTVTDRAMIREFFNNVSKEWTDKIQAKLDDLNQRGIDKSYAMTCQKCQHEWNAQIEFDPSTFFASAS
jgi:hypothetical protein